MKGMRYTAALPSIHLTRSGLTDLEMILLAHTSEPEITFELEDGSSTYEYSDAKEILQDPTLPHFIYDFTITVGGKEGVVELRGDNSANDKIQLWVSGDTVVSAKDFVGAICLTINQVR